MPRETTYSEAHADFDALCNEVAATREPVIIRRQNAEDVVLVAASELEGYLETAHLLHSPPNVERLLTSLARAQRQELASTPVEKVTTRSSPRGAPSCRR